MLLTPPEFLLAREVPPVAVLGDLPCLPVEAFLFLASLTVLDRTEGVEALPPALDSLVLLFRAT